MSSSIDKSVLVIAFVFPPYPGVGGRRWAKFVKYFRRHGKRVHVLCAQNPFSSESAWMQDVDGLKPIVVAIPSRFPAVLQIKPKSFFEKIAYRLSLQYLKFVSNGNMYERALFWKASMIREASEIIEREQVRNVIVTGPPFYCLHHSLELKRLNPSIRLIVDIRDMWTDNQSFLGYSSLSSSRMEEERRLEQEVIDGADVVVTVAEHMTKLLRNRSSNPKTKFETILNGFDSDDLEGIKPFATPSPTDSKIRLIFTGTLYDYIDSVMVPFVEALEALRNERSSLFHRLQFDFYGDAPKAYRDNLKQKFPQTCLFHGSVPLKEMYAHLAESHYAMLFLADDHAFSTSSKFFEYMAMRKKVLVFSIPGELGDFVEREHIGYAITPADMMRKLLDFIEAHDAGKGVFPAHFDVYQYSIDKLSKDYESLLA